MIQKKFAYDTRQNLEVTTPPLANEARSACARKQSPLLCIPRGTVQSVQYSLATEIKKINSTYKQAKKGLVGPGNYPTLNSNTLLNYKSKSIVYSFNKINNFSPLLTKTEYLLKSLFRSMYSLISKPVYLLKHDKVIIRLFVFLSPKLDKHLDTTTRSIKEIVGTQGYSALASAYGSGRISRSRREKLIKIITKIKSIRPTMGDILRYQIKCRVAAQEDIKLLANAPASSEGRSSKLSTLSNSPATPDQTGGQQSLSTLVSNFQNTLEKLSIIFGKIFNKKVEFEIIKAQLPFQDSNILAQVLGYNANKYNFRRMLKILIPRAVIKNPSRALSLKSPSNVPAYYIPSHILE